MMYASQDQYLFKSKTHGEAAWEGCGLGGRGLFVTGSVTLTV